jgi:glycosyltransferase involved in cell wall biosynthesis
MAENIKFTVFTPVYNRKHTINRVWESLQNQTYRNFEWIVVDDGSTDGVWDLLQRWKKEADFPVTLLQQENSG